MEKLSYLRNSVYASIVKGGRELKIDKSVVWRRFTLDSICNSCIAMFMSSEGALVAIVVCYRFGNFVWF